MWNKRVQLSPDVVMMALGSAAVVQLAVHVSAGWFMTMLIIVFGTLIAGAVGVAVEVFFKALKDGSKNATSSLHQRDGWLIRSTTLVLAAFGLITWLVPGLGFLTSVPSFLLSRRALNSDNRTLGLVSMGLSLIGVLLSLANSYIGVWNGMPRL